jgi:hypothetical protein
MKQEFFKEVAKSKRHCGCGKSCEISKGEQIIVFASKGRRGNLKLVCALKMIVADPV